MYIREYIGNESNMNITTHTNSQLLESKFKSGFECKYKKILIKIKNLIIIIKLKNKNDLHSRGYIKF